MLKSINDKFDSLIKESKKEPSDKIITIHCTEGAAKELMNVVEVLKSLGNIGSSREILIEDNDCKKGHRSIGFFDGDGNHRILLCECKDLKK